MNAIAFTLEARARRCICTVDLGEPRRMTWMMRPSFEARKSAHLRMTPMCSLDCFVACAPRNDGGKHLHAFLKIVRTETNVRSPQAGRHTCPTEWPRHRDGASEAAAMARRRHRSGHRDAVRSPYRAIHRDPW